MFINYEIELVLGSISNDLSSIMGKFSGKKGSNRTISPKYAFRKCRYHDLLIRKIVSNAILKESKLFERQQRVSEVEKNISLKQTKGLLQQIYNKINQGQGNQVLNTMSLFRYTFMRYNYHIQIERPFQSAAAQLNSKEKQLFDQFFNSRRNLSQNGWSTTQKCFSQNDCWNCINYLAKNQNISQQLHLDVKAYVNYVVKKEKWTSWLQRAQFEDHMIEPILAIANSFTQKGYIYIGLKQDKRNKEQRIYQVEGIKGDDKDEQTKQIHEKIKKVFHGIKPKIQDYLYSIQTSRIIVGQKSQKIFVYRTFVQIQKNSSEDIYYYSLQNSGSEKFFSHKPNFLGRQFKSSQSQYQLVGQNIYEYIVLKSKEMKKIEAKFTGYKPIKCYENFPQSQQEEEASQKSVQMKGKVEQEKLPWDLGPVKKLKFQSLVIVNKKGLSENCIEGLKSQMKIRKIIFSMYPQIYPQLKQKSDRSVYYFSHDIAENQFGQLIKNIDYFGRLMVWQSIEAQIQLIDKKITKLQDAINAILKANDNLKLNMKEQVESKIFYKKESCAIKFEDKPSAVFYFTLLDKLKIKSNFINKKKWDDEKGEKIKISQK